MMSMLGAAYRTYASAADASTTMMTMTRGETNIGVGALADLPESRAPALLASPPDHLSSFIAPSLVDTRPRTLF